MQKRVTMWGVDLIRWIQNKMKLTWKLAKIVKVHRGVLRIQSNIYNCFCKVNSTVDVWLGSEYASATVFLLPHLWKILNNERNAVKCTKQYTKQWKETRHKTWKKKKTKIAWINHRQNHQRCSIEKGVLKNFAKFTGKHPCQGLFFNQVTVAELRSAKMIIKDHKRWSDIFFIKEYPKHPILYLYLQKFLKLILQIQLI